MLNFLMREKGLIYSTLVAAFFYRWNRSIRSYFPQENTKIWWVEDQALLWEIDRELPPGGGICNDRVIDYLLARGALYGSGQKQGIAIFYNNGLWLGVDVAGQNIPGEGTDIIANPLSKSQLKKFLKKSKRMTGLIPVFNFTGTEIGMDYPLIERMVKSSPLMLGLGLLNTPRRINRYALVYRKDQAGNKEALQSELLELNDRQGIFADSKLIADETPLRYLPYSSSLLKVSLVQ
jgi:hypothetical protein